MPVGRDARRSSEAAAPGDGAFRNTATRKSAGAKTGEKAETYLCDAALAIIEAQIQREGRDFVFGEVDKGSFSGWSKAKAALDARAKSKLEPGSNLKPWRLHDLRRTTSTRMHDLGVLPHVVEAVLGHVSGFKAGVAGVYNRALYAKEKAKAMALWGRRLAAIVEG